MTFARMSHTPPSTSQLPPNLEWSGALELCRQHSIGATTLRKWREHNTGGLVLEVPGRGVRRLYRRSVLLRLCGRGES